MSLARSEKGLFRPGRDVVLLISVGALVFFANLGGPPLWDRDEPRNAGCAAEMMAANDWVVPTFNAELRTHKPILLYWLTIASYSVFGVNEFGARFASAVLGVGTVLLTFSIGRRLFDRDVGVWAGIILATTIMFGVASRAATPDSVLIFCVALSLWLFVRFAFPRDGDGSVEVGRFPECWGHAVAIYAAMGLGVLAKGPAGLVVPTAVIGMYLLIVRLPAQECSTTWFGRVGNALRPFAPLHFLKTCWAMRPLTAIASASIVALPWYIWVSLRTDGVWTREFLWTHNVSRATGVMEGHSGPPILFYVAAILIGFFPWSILTIPYGLRSYADLCSENQRLRRGTILMLCWVGVFVGLFSLASTKLPSYVTPCYPALAILAGRYVAGWCSSATFSTGWLRVGFAHLIVIGALLAVALPLASHRFLPGLEWLAVIGLVPLIGGIACWGFAVRDQHRSATAALAGTAILFAVCLTSIIPSAIGQQQRYASMLELASKHSGTVASFGHLEPTWVFYSGRPIREFQNSDEAELAVFLHENPDSLVITTESLLQQAAGQGVLADATVVQATEYFLRDHRLVLVQPNRDKTQHVAESSAPTSR